ncbi:MAG: GGDEF domain-containing protein, partial [Alphaproteobacteria bacterium]|nr:GGDEF domain-containing protein [Alphaproteobacteria bacterium]
RYRMAMRSAYRQTHMGRTRDELTGLYTHGFLHEHLGAQIAAAQAGRKYLTLGYFEIASLTKLNTAYGYAAGDHLLRQVGGIITSLVRAEDVPGRYHGGSLCVIMSETPKGEGQAALNRIGGVISNTEFAVMDVPEPVAVDFRNGSAELRDGDTPESLIQRAREDMG